MKITEIINEEGLIIPNVNTTKDVKPGETKRQGAKFGFDLDSNGVPPTISKDSFVHNFKPAPLSELTGTMSPLSYPGTRKWQDMKNKAKPGTDEWFKTWFSLPFLTSKKRKKVSESRQSKTDHAYIYSSFNKSGPNIIISLQNALKEIFNDELLSDKYYNLYRKRDDDLIEKVNEELTELFDNADKKVIELSEAYVNMIKAIIIQTQKEAENKLNKYDNN